MSRSYPIHRTCIVESLKLKINYGYMGLALASPIDVQTSSLVIIIDSCRAWCNTGKDSDFYCAFSTLALFTQLLKQNAVVQREESSLACYSVHISAGQLFLHDFMVLILVLTL